MITIDWQIMPPNNLGENNEEYFFPRLRDNGNTTNDELCEKAAKGSVFSPGTLIGALDHLVEGIQRELQEGRSVTIDGLGTFTLKVQANGKVTRQQLNRQESVRVQGVHFTPAAEMTRELQTAKFHWMPGGHSSKRNEGAIKQLLDTYFQTHDTISRMELQQLANLKQSTANYTLRRLVSAGYLHIVGSHMNTQYAKNTPKNAQKVVVSD